MNPSKKLLIDTEKIQNKTRTPVHHKGKKSDSKNNKPACPSACNHQVHATILSPFSFLSRDHLLSSTVRSTSCQPAPSLCCRRLLLTLRPPPFASLLLPYSASFSLSLSLPPSVPSLRPSVHSLPLSHPSLCTLPPFIPDRSSPPHCPPLTPPHPYPILNRTLDLILLFHMLLAMYPCDHSIPQDVRMGDHLLPHPRLLIVALPQS